MVVSVGRSIVVWIKTFFRSIYSFEVCTCQSCTLFAQVTCSMRFLISLKYISYIIYFLFLIHIFTFMPEDYSVTEFQHLCQMAEYEDYTVIDVDFIMTTLTQLRLSLSLSLYEVAAFKLLFPYWNPMEPSPPADKRGIRFLYRSVRLHFAFFGLAGLCPYSFVLFCRSKFFILKPNTTKLGQWPSLYTIIWLVSILPN